MPRILPNGLGVQIEQGSWEVPKIFRLIQQGGEVSEREMLEVFNMGVGFVLIVSPEVVQEVQRLAAEPLYPIGEVVEGSGVEIR